MDSFKDVMVSGTRNGLTPPQEDAFLSLFDELRNVEKVRHGNCIGVDSDVDKLVRSKLTSRRDVSINIHPPLDEKESAFCEGRDGACVVHPPKAYLKRNNTMVDGAQLVIAFPKSTNEQRRGSGTWQVIRRAKKRNKPLIVVYPRGEEDRVNL